ncbi:thiamine phosphate synthase [Asticcacaulis solisilvae]|uniref:thiamine phosphate synthase n=1 Tax=Asticcacaulis solisilvae TaxID=1217274 RepID=UPI003FD72A74
MTNACRLYLITPPLIADLSAFEGTLEDALSAGDVAALQIRLKDVSLDAIREAVKVLMPVAHRHDVAVVMNDHVDLARELGTDGVHVGQSDMAYKDARRILGSGAMIGVTCHNSRHLAMEAAEAGADYVAFGAFYPTTTKTVEHMAELDTLSIWQETMETPCVAIGGITAENARAVAGAGADFIAVSGAVWNHAQGASAGVSALLEALAQDSLDQDFLD